MQASRRIAGLRQIGRGGRRRAEGALGEAARVAVVDRVSNQGQDSAFRRRIRGPVETGSERVDDDRELM